jgi:hypothetical protein
MISNIGMFEVKYFLIGLFLVVAIALMVFGGMLLLLSVLVGLDRKVIKGQPVKNPGNKVKRQARQFFSDPVNAGKVLVVTEELPKEVSSPKSYGMKKRMRNG